MKTNDESSPILFRALKVRPFVTLLILVHCSAVILGMITNRKESYIEKLLLVPMGPYIHFLNLGMSRLPLETITSYPSEGPFLVTFHRQSEDNERWTFFEYPSRSRSEQARFGRWLQSLVRFAADEDDRADTMALRLAMLVLRDSKDSTVDGLRIARRLIVERKLYRQAVQEGLNPTYAVEPSYEASIVRVSDSEFGLVRNVGALRSSKSKLPGNPDLR